MERFVERMLAGRAARALQARSDAFEALRQNVVHRRCGALTDACLNLGSSEAGHWFMSAHPLRGCTKVLCISGMQSFPMPVLMRCQGKRCP